MFCLLHLPELNKRQELHYLGGHPQLLQNTILGCILRLNAAMHLPTMKPFVFSTSFLNKGVIVNPCNTLLKSVNAILFIDLAM